jgi:hypothetical protein
MLYFGFTDYRLFSVSWWKERLNPRTYYKAVKWFSQRGLRGWADCDAWNLDNYLDAVLPSAIRSLKKAHSYPPDLTPDEWNEILEKMAVGFKAREKRELMTFLDPIYTELSQKWEEGFALFVKYYGDLWD